MKVKALWGFIGNARLLGADSAKVVAGQVFEKVEPEYGHTLVGKGLVEEIVTEGKLKAGKPAAPKTSKPGAPKETKPIVPEAGSTAPAGAPVEVAATTEALGTGVE